MEDFVVKLGFFITMVIVVGLVLWAVIGLANPNVIMYTVEVLDNPVVAVSILAAVVFAAGFVGGIVDYLRRM